MVIVPSNKAIGRGKGGLKERGFRVQGLGFRVREAKISSDRLELHGSRRRKRWRMQVCESCFEKVSDGECWADAFGSGGAFGGAGGFGFAERADELGEDYSARGVFASGGGDCLAGAGGEVGGEDRDDQEPAAHGGRDAAGAAGGDLGVPGGKRSAGGCDG